MTYHASSSSSYRSFVAVLVALFVILFVPFTIAYAVESDGHDHVHASDAEQHGVGDGHTDHTHPAGGSSLLTPWSAQWWGLLFFSIGATGLLSYGVYRYLQVPEVKSTQAMKNEQKASLPAESGKP